MPSVLLIVFLLQLTIHLLNTYGAQAINDLLWNIYTKLPTPQSKDASESAKLKSEVVRLHAEMKSISAQDDFARWARVRRDHDKAKDKYEKQSASLQSFQATFNKAFSFLRWGGTQGLQFLCNFYYSKQPLFWLPQGWVPWHVEWVLSFPRAPVGSVSINIWAMACAAVIAMASEGIKAALTLKEGKVVEGKNKGEKIQMEPMSAGQGKKKM